MRREIAQAAAKATKEEARQAPKNAVQEHMKRALKHRNLEYINSLWHQASDQEESGGQ